jgi:hypothetical protein
MRGPKGFRNQTIESLFNEFIGRVSEQAVNLRVGEYDATLAIDNYHGVRKHVQEFTQCKNRIFHFSTSLPCLSIAGQTGPTPNNLSLAG